MLSGFYCFCKTLTKTRRSCWRLLSVSLIPSCPVSCSSGARKRPHQLWLWWWQELQVWKRLQLQLCPWLPAGGADHDHMHVSGHVDWERASLRRWVCPNLLLGVLQRGFSSPFVTNKWFFSPSSRHLREPRRRSAPDQPVQPPFERAAAWLHMQLPVWSRFWPGGSLNHSVFRGRKVEWSHTYLQRCGNLT